jgi:tRNA pseudouridine55 synthase
MNKAGIVLIDKPQGPSSFDVVRKVRKLCGTKRVGHAGTLDPKARGLLVVAIGSYTKLCGYLSENSKIYEATIELGISTTTDDQEGEIIAQKSIAQLTPEHIKNACTSFQGIIKQVPPRYSAIKLGGQRAYKMARAQVDFNIAPREVEIFSLDIQEINMPYLRIRTHCSKGTYIRSLARDIGDILGVGAHARDIRRMASGTFNLCSALDYDNLSKEIIEEALLSDHRALSSLQSLNINKELYDAIRHGRPIDFAKINYQGIIIALFENKPVAILAQHDGALRLIRNI